MPDDFERQLQAAYQKKVEERITKATRWVALECLRRAVLKSPVLSGRFRGNWQVAISVRPDGVVEVEDKDGGPTISEGSRNIAQLKPFEVVHLVNNLPYSQKIEEGHSGQAPAGVVSVTVAEIEAFFASIPADQPIP